MNEVEIVLLLLLLVAALTVLARRVSVPYPILMTLGGLVLSLVSAWCPALRRSRWRRRRSSCSSCRRSCSRPRSSPRRTSSRPTRARSACWRSGWCWSRRWRWGSSCTRWCHPWAGRRPSRWARSCRRPMRWPPTAIAQRLGLPRRVVTILEGESLVNDATALVALRLAIAATVCGHLLATGGNVRLRGRERRGRRLSAWWSAGLWSRSRSASTTRRWRCSCPCSRRLRPGSRPSC